MVDEDAGELVADGAVDERGGDRRVDAPGQPADDLLVADLSDGGRAVRDSKDPQGPILRFDRESWAGFIDDVKRGEFDL